MESIAALASACSTMFLARASERPLAALDVNPSDLLALSRRHRVQGLCWAGLRANRYQLPPQIAAAFDADTRDIAQAGLRAAAATREIVERFARAELAVLFLKGQAVGQLAYGDPFLKMSADVDVLVDPADVPAAATLLEGLDYRVEVPGSRSALERWHRLNKESVWVRPGSPAVELHSRVADHPQLLPGLGVRSPRQAVDIGFGLELPTFARDELFAYLAVHGASSAWFRLKWLSDLAALLAGADEAEIDRLHRRSVELQAGRAGGLALLLSHRLFGTKLSQVLSAELRRDWGTEVLAKIAMGQLLAHPEPTQRPLGTAGIHLSQLLLKPGLGFATSEIVRQARQIAARH